MKSKTYRELIKLPTFDERFEYLKLDGQVGVDTFGFDRWLNQDFYRSEEWKRVRRKVIVRDNGCDLGLPGYEIRGKIFVHHMNPLFVDQIIHADPAIINPDYLICCSKKTHDAIHYGDISYPDSLKFVERKPWDTCPWKQGGWHANFRKRH